MTTILIQTKEELSDLIKDIISETIKKELKPIFAETIKEIIKMQKKHNAKKRFLNMKEVQTLLGCSYPTLRKMMDNRALHFKKMEGCKEYHFLYEDIVKMIADEDLENTTYNSKIKKIA